MMNSEADDDEGTKRANLGPAVVIHARRSVESGILVVGVDLSVGGTRIKLSFDQDRRIEQVFGIDVAPLILSLCDQAPAEAGVMSKPDLHVAVAGCEIRGAAILSRIYAEHVTALTIRIRKLQGNATRLLHPEVLNDDQSLKALSAAVDNAIERIYMPLRNFEHSIDAALRETATMQVERLHAQIIAFRTEIDNVCYNFERLLSDDLVRVKENEAAQLGIVEPSTVFDGRAQSPPTLRIVPSSG
ncbi:hypothetical protein SAMN06273572_104273 [Monaibacterium marinum]|uniref:Uncharacterized protein n=1 Tax=Pontivivens marinum TaxID=1690039 RepID=A0A2C9CTN0_9RHOB|nr:hypothetical protein [Monaibacterium marinum]SOH94573.1 hypothetical protein SAMN06273572_104273 [Monaibacterium marinum]